MNHSIEPASGYTAPAVVNATETTTETASSTPSPIAPKNWRSKVKQKFPPAFPELIYGYHFNDVLSGRGATVNAHPGNKRFRSLCADRKAEFEVATNVRKREIALDVVESVLRWNPPGRFIERVDDAANFSPEFSEVDCERMLTGVSAAYFYQMGYTFKRNKRLMKEIGPWRDMGIERAIQKACGVIRDYKRPDRIALRAIEMLKEKNATNANTNDKYGDDAINTKHENTSAYNEIVPTSNDVLLGRGAFINEHSGNRRFRNLALEHKLLFDAACLADKRQLSLDIVSLIKALNPRGRFLRRAPVALQEPVLLSDGKYRLPPRGLEGQWEEVTEQQACAKATQVMRDIRDIQLPELRQSTASLSTGVGITFVENQEAQVMASDNVSDPMDIYQEKSTWQR